MFPADFAYARPRSLDEALDLLGEARDGAGDAKLIAGGQSLLPMMKLRLAAPQVLIDIADLDELRRSGWHGSSQTLGALTTYRQLARDPLINGGLVARRDDSVSPRRAPGVPAITDALAVLADPQVRARGTIGGAVAHGDPASDLPAVLLALDAKVVVAARPGGRTVLLDDFLQGIYTTDLADDEIITQIRIPTDGARASAYEKFPHPASHLPLAGVAVVLTLNGGTLTDTDGDAAELADGRIANAAIAVTGISPRPYRARETERLLVGAPPTPDVIAAAAARVTAAPKGRSAGPGTAGDGQVTLLGDQHAGAAYRAHLAEVLTRRALARALARAGAR